MSERDMWDSRFAGEGYVYGIEPNAFLVEQASRFPAGGRVLSLGAGEGRNEVWMAGHGFRVTALDSSSVGLGKLRLLAASRGVEVETVLADASEAELPEASFDAAVLIFLHLGSAARPAFHARIWRALKPGGLFLAELFRMEQIERRSGGPRNPDFLYRADELARDLPEAEWIVLRALERELSEGVDVVGFDADAFRADTDAAIARSAEYLVYFLGLLQLPYQGVLPPAGSYNQYFHVFLRSLSTMVKTKKICNAERFSSHFLPTVASPAAEVNTRHVCARCLPTRSVGMIKD